MTTIAAILGKISRRQRIDANEALRAFRDAPLPDLGLASEEAALLATGRDVFFNVNRHLNPTNLCAVRCRFCGFRRSSGEPESFTLSLEEIEQKAIAAHGDGATEIHITGGLHPEWSLSSLVEILKAVRRGAPNASLKAFTAVEIHHFARKEGKSTAHVLGALAEAGLASLTGGGAEIFHPEVRQRICPEKIDAETWLSVHREAHKMGISTTCTMLYGHVENLEHRVDHLLRLRDLQDETQGFRVFVPLRYQPWSQDLAPRSPLTAADDLRNMAMARAILDNFLHIKAYWAMLGRETAQLALHFGANDLDGTVVDERIARMAGSAAGQGMARDSLIHLIRSAGRNAVERDTDYKERNRWEAQSTPPLVPLSSPRRMGTDEALSLLRTAPLHTLGERARRERNARHHPGRASFLIDRNINYTNICRIGCRFCAFHRAPGTEGGWVLPAADVFARIEETLALGGTGILLQGGVNPDLGLTWFEDLFRAIKERYPIHLHALSAVEVDELAKREGLTLETTLSRLRASGLDSIPGAGAEILVDAVRHEQSPRKISATRWLEVHGAAHRAGLPTTATMMFGSVDSDEHIVEHLARIRAAQDESGGFYAFIPWTFQSRNTPLEREGVATPWVTPSQYLRVLAVARLFLDNIPHVQGSRVTMGPAVGQLSLLFGANDLGSVMIEENVVRSAGVAHDTSAEELRHLIAAAGFAPFQRDSYFREVRSDGRHVAAPIHRMAP